MGGEPLRRRRGEGDAGRRRERLEVGGAERRQHDLRAVAGCLPGETGGQLGQRVRARREHQHHPVGHEPAGDEQDGAERRQVDPVRVVEHHQQRRLPLELGQPVEQSQPHRDVAGLGGRRRRREQAWLGGADQPEELVGEAVGHDRLAGLAADPDRPHVGCRRGEPVDERGLPGARRAGDEDGARATGAGLLELTPQRREFGGTTDEDVGDGRRGARSGEASSVADRHRPKSIRGSARRTREADGEDRLARPRLQAHVAVVAVADDPHRGVEPEPGARADRLGGEERVEDAPLRRPRGCPGRRRRSGPRRRSRATARW